MKRLFFCLLVLFLPPLMPGAAADTATWQPAAAPAAPTAAAPAETEDLAGALSEVVGRKGITGRQRRALGLTFRNLRLVLRELHTGGRLEGLSRSDLALVTLEHLMEGNPQAYANDQLDFDAILDFLERIIPIILKLIELFG